MFRPMAECTLDDLAEAARLWREDTEEGESRLLDVLLDVSWRRESSYADLATASGLSGREVVDLVNRASERAWGGWSAIWEECDAVTRHPDWLSGAWRFRDSRVPVDALFRYLEDGATIAEFFASFPGVSEQAQQVLDHLRRSVAPRAHSV